MSDFDFGAMAKNADAYHAPIQDVAPVGNYVFKIVDIEKQTSGGGYPKLALRLECDEGVQWDNIVISPNEFSVQKLLGLIESAGLERPDPDAGEINPKTGELSDAYAQKLFGKQVGGIVRPEAKRVKDEASGQYMDDPTGAQTPRIKGYCDPAKLAGATGAHAVQPGATQVQPSAADADIPF